MNLEDWSRVLQSDEFKFKNLEWMVSDMFVGDNWSVLIPNACLAPLKDGRRNIKVFGTHLQNDVQCSWHF